MPRFSRRNTRMRRGGTLMSFARRYCAMPIGFRNSSDSTSPGCTGGSFEDLVVVDDFDFVGMTGLPFETHAPLHIDRDAPLASSIALQLLEPIARRDEQVVNACSRVQHLQFAECHRLKVG